MIDVNMFDINNYAQKEFWTRKGENFSIEIVRWDSKDAIWNNNNDISGYRKVNRWNVYCYIYPKHKLFDSLTEDICRDGIKNLHCGATYCHWDRDKDGVVHSKCYGSDYMHYRDCYENIDRIDGNWQVTKDAEDLFNELTEKDK